jgi:predicted ester cyclase
MMRGGFPDI